MAWFPIWIRSFKKLVSKDLKFVYLMEMSQIPPLILIMLLQRFPVMHLTIGTM